MKCCLDQIFYVDHCLQSCLSHHSDGDQRKQHEALQFMAWICWPKDPDVYISPNHHELPVVSLLHITLRLRVIAIWCKTCPYLVNIFFFGLYFCSEVRFFCHLAISQYHPLGFLSLWTESEFFVKAIIQRYWVLGCFFFLSFSLAF